MNSDKKKRDWFTMMDARLHPSNKAWGTIFKDLLDTLNKSHSSTVVNACLPAQLVLVHAVCHGPSSVDVCVVGVHTRS
jgi:hypothetical protein